MAVRKGNKREAEQKTYGLVLVLKKKKKTTVFFLWVNRSE